jgi:hypothetical protein
MSSVAEIEQAILKLSSREFVELEDWAIGKRQPLEFIPLPKFPALDALALKN